MLSNRTASQPSRFTIPAVDEAGNPIDAVSASWELFDERGVSIDAGVVADFEPSIPEVSFEIEAASMNLADGEISSGREIVVSLTQADGDEIELRDYFVLVARNPLAVAQNSFVTFPEALRVRGEFGSLDGWDGAPRERQQAALVEAYRRLCRMSFKVPGANLDGSNVNRANYGTGTDEGWAWGSRVRVSTLSQAQFDALPATFRHAVKRAQLAEANVLLGGDPVGAKRQAGIVSETTGESSMFFQSRPHLNLPISRQAYEEVKRYVSLRIGLLRG
jgi:hypothetical protein